MFVGKGDFEEHEWEEIRKKEIENHREKKRLYFNSLKLEIYEWKTNIKWEFHLRKIIKKEHYQKGMK